VVVVVVVVAAVAVRGCMPLVACNKMPGNERWTWQLFRKI